MATETKEKTRDEVARLHKSGKSPQEIAAALDKTPATIYSHLRNLGFGHGKRGRPPKDGAQETSKAKVTTRPRPGTQKAATTATTAKRTPAASNGHDVTGAERFPKIKAAIEDELRDARSKVAMLEGMLNAVSG